jgi:2-iminobutanoate/2-iminopropanoate deaminase
MPVQTSAERCVPQLPSLPGGTKDHATRYDFFLCLYDGALRPDRREKASRPASGPVRFINPPGWVQNPRFTQVVEITKGRTILISGQIAFDKDGNVVGKGYVRAQSARAIENLKLALDGVGATFNDVVKLDSYLVEMPSNLPAYREVRAQYLAKNEYQPASTTIGVSALVHPDLLLEVEAVVVLPRKKR